MADRIRIEIFVSKGAVSTKVGTTRPMNWSGRSSRHRSQIQAVTQELAATIADQLRLAEAEGDA